MKKLLLLLLALSLTIFVTACGDDESENGNENAQEDSEGQDAAPTFEVTEEEIVEADEVVLKVNGTDVYGDKYNPVYYQTKQRMFQYGLDTSDLEVVKEQTYSELIAQELIKQDAQANGLEVSEDEVSTEMEALKAEGEEDLQAYLEQFDLTEEDFEEQLKFNLLVDKYLNNAITVEEVTDDEIQEMYDLLKEQNEEMMELEEAEELIRQQLAQQKQSEQLQAKLEELEENAEIEELL